MTGKMKAFVDFCHSQRLLNAPTATLTIDPSLMAHYAAWLYATKRNTTYKSLTSYLSAVNAWCAAHGQQNPSINPTTGKLDYQYASVKKAIHKRFGDPAVNRMPITTYHMESLIHIARKVQVINPIQSFNIIAMTTLAWFGLLRIGEITTLPGTVFNPTKHASRGDIRFEPSIDNATHYTFFVKSSKTDQFGKGALVKIFRTGGTLCPVAAMTKLIRHTDKGAHHPLFSLDTTGQASATRAAFSSTCNTLLRAAGIHDATLKPHSFRQGGASAAIQVAQHWQVQAMGRWKSDAWRDYVFIDDRVLSHTQKAMSLVPRIPANTTGRVIDY